MAQAWPDVAAGQDALRTADGRNAARVLCVRCDSVVLRPRAALWDARELDVPKASANAKNALREGDSEALRGFWRVDDMMAFENVGFTMTVDNRLKYLCCADCEAGPLGVQVLDADPKSCYVAASRVRYVAT